MRTAGNLIEQIEKKWRNKNNEQRRNNSIEKNTLNFVNSKPKTSKKNSPLLANPPFFSLTNGKLLCFFPTHITTSPTASPGASSAIPRSAVWAPPDSHVTSSDEAQHIGQAPRGPFPSEMVKWGGPPFKGEGGTEQTWQNKKQQT